LLYERQILQILSEAGERGVSVQALAKHVYNMNNTLFAEPPVLDDIHHYVQQYLLRSSKSPKSAIERTGVRGFYRLNPHLLTDAQHQMLHFKDAEKNEESESSCHEDLSLSLF